MYKYLTLPTIDIEWIPLQRCNCFIILFPVIKLEQRYPYPKAVIEDIFTSLKAVDIGSYPKLSVVPKLGGRCWCARLEFTWPIEFSVTGKSADRETAEKFAYLQACDLFKVNQRTVVPKSSSD